MTETNETHKRLTALEETTSWLKDRVWFGTGNLHGRVHNLEDRSADRSFEIDKIKGDLQKVERVLGLDGTYGEKSIISDLRDALDTIQNLKGNVITVKDFQKLMNDVDTLKQRGQAQITLVNVIQIAFITGAISILLDAIKSALFGTP